MNLFEMIKRIEKTDEANLKNISEKINSKLKPPGSLGMLEDIATKMSLIRNDLNPIIKKKMMFVFAADHGISDEGVSAYPASITPQMVYSFLNNKAAINVLCNHNNIDIKVIDMGVNHDFKKKYKNFFNKKVQRGTRNFLREKAMTENDAVQCIQNGIDVFFEVYNESKFDILGVGDMGIGNTTSSAAIISAVTGVNPEDATGRGTGIDDERLKNKIEIIKNALEKHNPDNENAIDILSKLGGYEIGGIAGAILSCAYTKVPVVIDGIISTAGALLAYLLNNNTAYYMFAGHKSVEKGQSLALEYLHLSPILDLRMRLGEGTGAALSMNVIEASCKIMCDMGSFDDIVI